MQSMSMTPISFGFIVNPPPVSRWTRLRWWLSEHRPALHFGPCDR